MYNNSYLSHSGTILVLYRKELLKSIYILKEDVVEFDGLKHDISMYEENLNLKCFKKVDDTTVTKIILNENELIS
jgi:hypothetical protein